MAVQFKNEEPLIVAAGDTIAFQKAFPQYLPSAGWQLQYQIRGGAGKQLGGNDVAFASVPDATNTLHQITVAANITAPWSPGEYLLAGYAVNAGTGERKEIYENAILISPNLNSPTDNVSVKTFSQKAIENLECVYLELTKSYLLETNVQQTQIVREKREAVRKELLFWYEKRANEVALENVRNGRPSGQKIRPVMNIIGGGCGPFFPRS